jgi:hypothetical protein
MGNICGRREITALSESEMNAKELAKRMHSHLFKNTNQLELMRRRSDVP